MKRMLISWFSGILCLALISAFFPPVPVTAEAAQALAGGTFTVNSEADTIASDNFLTLREAMSVATGVLTGPFTAAERSLLAGCTFNASGFITSGCGAGGDSIIFAPTLKRIALTSGIRLPFMNKDGVSIDGTVTSGKVVIDAAGGVDYGFNVAANNVTLKDLAIINISGFGATVSLGNGNWKNLRVFNDYLGIVPGASSCSDPAIVARPFFTAIIFSGSGSAGPGNGTAYFYNNVIGCSQNDGIAISNASYVYVGQTPAGVTSGNWVGVTTSGANIGNGGSGISICCSTATTGNLILSNRVGYNSHDGILVQAVSGNTLSYNDVFHNGGAGIRILDSDHTAINNNSSHENNSSGIWLTQSNATPLVTFANSINGGSYYSNLAAGITEGEGANNNSWQGISTYNNFGLGVDKFDNGVPNPPPLTLTGTIPIIGGVQVNGHLGGTIFALTDYHIELYLVAPDPTGLGEGKVYLGYTDVFWNAQGNYDWSIPTTTTPGCYTAILTIIDAVHFLSSEFSFNLGTRCLFTYLPVIQ